MLLSRRSRLFFFKSWGFTFLEIMLVVAIIGIMLAVVGPRLVGKTKKAKITTTRLQIQQISAALGMYEQDQGDFPTTEQGLEALVTRPSDVSEDTWSKYMKEAPRDSWNQKFQYACPSEHGGDFDLVSAGPDGRFDTEDDIANYKKQATE